MALSEIDADTGAGTGAGGLWGAITDVPGVLVGHAERIGAGWCTGVSVVLPPPGCVGAVDVRGGGPGTRETDALAATTLVSTVDAVALAGGSAYGLSAADGVLAWCEEQGRGYAVGPPEDPRSMVVPIVPAAVIFDLGRGGDVRARPDAAMGRAAAQACERPSSRVHGSIGAGAGALMAGRTLKGGLGTACVHVSGVEGARVGALAVVNAAGSPVEQVTGRLLGEAFVPAGLPRPGVARAAPPLPPPPPRGEPQRQFQTTLIVVATNADMDVATATRMAGAAHDGLARAISPVHTLVDGDTAFALATRDIPLPDVDAVRAVQAAAADAALLAVLDAVLAATSVQAPGAEAPAYLDLPALP